MVDVVSLAVAIAGIIAAGVALYEIKLSRDRISLQREDLDVQKRVLEATVNQLNADEDKIEGLRSIVKALSDLVTAQAKQIEAVEQANKIAADALQVARANQALAAEKLAWDKMNPIDKAGMAVREVLSRGVEDLKRGMRRLLNRG